MVGAAAGFVPTRRADKVVRRNGAVRKGPGKPVCRGGAMVVVQHAAPPGITPALPEPAARPLRHAGPEGHWRMPGHRAAAVALPRAELLCFPLASRTARQSGELRAARGALFAFSHQPAANPSAGPRSSSPGPSGSTGPALESASASLLAPSYPLLPAAHRDPDDQSEYRDQNQEEGRLRQPGASHDCLRSIRTSHWTCKGSIGTTQIQTCRQLQ